MPEVTADGRPLIKCTSCKAFRLTEEFENDEFGQKRKNLFDVQNKKRRKKMFSSKTKK